MVGRNKNSDGFAKVLILSSLIWRQDKWLKKG